MKESEILDIIERRKVLVETATSEAQREIYQGYLEFWQRKIAVEIGSIIEDLIVEQREEEFKLQFPNKNAYYTRDGITHKTKAFKEFLISNQ